VHERPDPSPKSRSGSPDALGHRPHATVPPGEQRHDPICLTQLLSTKNDSFVAIGGHKLIVSPTTELPGI
jgi:hypothetical protein